MTRFRRFIALFLAVGLALSPVVASARAGALSSGSGRSAYSSMGSMGSRTYQSAPGAQPIQRSMTQNASPAWGQPGASSLLGAGSYYPHHSFLSGMLGGLTGAWIGSMLFGHGGYGYYGGFGHGGGFLGTLLLMGICFWIGRKIFRDVFRAAPLLADRPMFYQANGGGFGGYRPALPPVQPELALNDRDLAAFGEVLIGVQASWSQGDLDRMRRYVTPEMLSYFSEMQANNASKGVANRVENVTLLQGEPRGAWSEGVVDYATAWLRWSAIDFTHRTDRAPTDPAWLVEGDPRQPSIAEEVWTFRRAAGGRWLLSAIQQTA